MSATLHDVSSLRALAGAREHADLDLPTVVDGRRVPPVRILRSLLRKGEDMAMDGCRLEDGRRVCERHASPGWLHVLDLGE